jgi:hypothetical protein
VLSEFTDTLIWIIRLALFAGLCWGAWLCIGHVFLPARSEKTMQFEHFATFALLILLLTTIGGVIHAG